MILVFKLNVRIFSPDLRPFGFLLFPSLKIWVIFCNNVRIFPKVSK